MTDATATAQNVTLDILNEFQEQIDVDKVYSLKEMKDVLSEIFKVKNIKPKKNTVKKEKTAKKAVKKTDDMDTETDEEVETKKKGRPTKVKLDKDGNEKAKRAPTAYNNFVGKRIKELKLEHPETKAVELMKMASISWKEMTQEQKDEYKQ